MSYLLLAYHILAFFLGGGALQPLPFEASGYNLLLLSVSSPAGCAQLHVPCALLLHGLAVPAPATSIRKTSPGMSAVHLHGNPQCSGGFLFPCFPAGPSQSLIYR